MKRIQFLQNIFQIISGEMQFYIILVEKLLIFIYYCVIFNLNDDKRQVVVLIRVTREVAIGWKQQT